MLKDITRISYIISIIMFISLCTLLMLIQVTNIHEYAGDVEKLSIFKLFVSLLSSIFILLILGVLSYRVFM